MSSRDCGTRHDKSALAEIARRSRRHCAFGSRRGKRPRAGRGALAEISAGNSGSDKQNEPSALLSRKGDCDNGLRRRSPNRGRHRAIHCHAERFGVARLEIARANAPARVEACDRSRQPPVRLGHRDPRVAGSMRLTFRENPRGPRPFLSAGSIPRELRAQVLRRRVGAADFSICLRARDRAR